MALSVFFQRLTGDYAEIISSFLIPIVIGIFTFALPLLLQTAARVDSKYNSTLLIKVFRKDWICRGFLFTLLASLAACLLVTLQLPRCVNWGNTMNMLIDYSALILLLISTIALTIFVFLTIWLIYVFYLPEKLLKRLIGQYKNTKSEDVKETTFRAIGYIFLYSIRTEGESLARQIYVFYEKEFDGFGQGKTGQITYPNYYYDVIFDANECLCHRERKSLSLFRGSFYRFLINPSMQNTISENTYSFLWRILRQYLFYDRNEYISSYWDFAHQYASNLSGVHQKYDDNYNVINQEDVDFWNKEKERFLEFHYALGGLLMYKQKYSLLSQLMSWSSSIPPSYYLVPETMSEVINRFIDVSSVEKQTVAFYYEGKYPFPDVQGVKTGYVIQKWISRYIAVLFLRQYTLGDYYSHTYRLGMPAPPSKLSEKKKWIEELNNLRYHVKEYLKSPQLLGELGMGYLSSEDWYKEAGKVHPLILIDAFKHDIDFDMEKTMQEQPVEADKLESFIRETKRILSKTFEYGERFLQQGEEPHEPKLAFYGKHSLLDKAAFAGDSDVSYVNEDTITAESLDQEFTHCVTNIFFFMKRLQYFVKELDLFNAIDQLSINEKDFVILNTGLYLKYYRDYLKINGLVELDGEKWQYKNVEIINIPSNRLISFSFIVIKKNDLPFISYKETQKELISKYSLVEIDPERKIYANIIDLNDSALLDEESKKSGINEDELRKKVLACVDINAVVSCKQKATCVQLKIFSQFDDSGNPINVEEIKSPWKQSSHNTKMHKEKHTGSKTN